MKRKTVATIAIVTLLFVLMMWSFGSSAANKHENPAEQNPGEQQSSAVFQDQDENEPDADLGKFGSRIDREEYLRARDEYIARKRGIEPGRPFDPTLRGRAIEQMDRQEKNSRLESIVSGDLTPAAGGAWAPIGPLTLPNGVGSNSGPTSGRVTAIAVDPTNSQKVYLGTAQGGVWRSLDGGTTWTSIFDNAQTMAIGALAVAPSSPSTLYVGTGEFNSCGDCFFGVGLYRIDNADTAATLVGPINPQQTIGNLTYNVFNGRSITKILVHPTDPATIWVSTARGVGGSGANAFGSIPQLAPRGVFRSSNATTSSPTFQKLTVNLDGSVDSPPSGNADVVDMVMEPGTPDNILVAVIGLTSQNGGIYRSTNATTVTPTFSQTKFLATGVRTSLAINKTGSVVTVYAATSETPKNTTGCTTSGSGAIYKSITGGATWPDTTQTGGGQLTGGGGFCAGQCFYDMPIAVDPNDANTVFIGGQTSTTCGRLVGRSTDGGNTFPSISSGLHADDHALVFDGAGNIYTGNDGGVFKISTTAANNAAWTNLNSSPLNTLQFESIAVHPTDQFLMIGGTQDNGTEFQQTSSGNWRRAESGDGGYALIDQSATDTTNVTMYHTFFNNSGQIGFDRIFKAACLPAFDSWPTRGAGFGGTGDPEAPAPFDPCDGGTPGYLHNGLVLTPTVLFYAPMALGPGSPNTVYFGSDRLYRSSDRGDTMTAVSQVPLSGTNPISTIAIWNRGDNIRMVGLQNGQVFATSTGSSTLVDISPPIPANPSGSTINKFIGRAMIDPNNKNVAYVALSYYAPAGQGIWKITNLNAAGVSGGAAPVWAAAGSGIPSIPINGFAIDPLNSNNLYAGTDIGVYFSSDAGASWTPFGSGLPRVAVFDLQIQPTSRILRAGTHGRGIWETALLNPAASTLQFSASTASVTEGTGSASVDATVTVTRSGDISFPASVNYATSDTSGANGCGVINGAASSRCDYIATSGTLNFAAGQSSQTITIPITYDSFAEGPEVFNVNLSSPTGLNAGLGSQSTITITINDSGFTGPNQIDTSGFFVREHYVDFLNREPDASGLSFWTNQMTNCGASDLLVCKINVSGAFFLSIEFQQTGYLVERIYKTAFGDATGTSTTGGSHTLRVPVIRLNQFLPDTQRIGQGVVVGVGNWQQQLDDNKNAFTEEFVKRSTFLTALPLSLTPAQFVDTLNSNAKDNNNAMPLSSAERDNLVNALTNGTMTRAQVLRAVAEDADLANSEKNRAFVLMQYFGYLRRNPNDPQDSDYAGYEFWLGKLNAANGDYIAAEMVKAFITADEYRHRFAAN
jgi:hypothetical protein